VSTPPAAPARRGLQQWAGLAGVAYVVLFIGGVIFASNGQPDNGGAPLKLIHYYKDSGNRDKIYIGFLIVVIGIFFFIWFLSALRQYLRAIDGDGLLTGVATIGGAVSASLTLAGFGLESAIKTMSDDTFHHQVYPSLIHAADDAGYVMHAAGDVGMAALMIAASLAAMRAVVVPRWAGWLGVVSGVLAIFAVFFFPMILVALWVIVVGVLLFRATPPLAARPAAAV